MNNTLIIVKPDGVARGLAGKIIDRFEQRGYKIKNLKLMKITQEIAEKHYFEHKDKNFFGELVDFITSGPSLIMQIEGEGIINSSRTMIGATNPVLAMPGTIRGDFASTISSNLVHASDSEASALREISIFFGGN